MWIVRKLSECRIHWPNRYTIPWWISTIYTLVYVIPYIQIRFKTLFVEVLHKQCIHNSSQMSWWTDPSAEFFGVFGRLITFFGRYSASRKFLGGLRPAFFSADFRLIPANMTAYHVAIGLYMMKQHISDCGNGIDIYTDYRHWILTV